MRSLMERNFLYDITDTENLPKWMIVFMPLILGIILCTIPVIILIDVIIWSQNK